MRHHAEKGVISQFDYFPFPHRRIESDEEVKRSGSETAWVSAPWAYSRLTDPDFWLWVLRSQPRPSTGHANTHELPACFRSQENHQHCLCWKVAPVKVKVAQWCLTLCDPLHHTVHGILQARIPEWVAFPFSRGSSQPRDQNQVSSIASGFFTSWPTREVQEYWSGKPVSTPVDLPDPGIEPGSPALQADSLLIELSGKPQWLAFSLPAPGELGCLSI